MKIVAFILARGGSKRIPLKNIKLIGNKPLIHYPIALAKKEITDSAVRRVMVMAGDDIDDLLTLCRADITTKNPQRVKKYMSNFEQVELKMKDVAGRDSLKSFQSPVRGAEIMKICGLTEDVMIVSDKITKFKCK